MGYGRAPLLGQAPRVEIIRWGLISDTHGLLRPAVLELFRGVDRIIHAGDVGRPEILWDLEAVAPVSAVWGNVDGPEVRALTRESLVETVGEVRVAVVHGHLAPDPDALPAEFPAVAAVIHGHSHLPRCDRSGDVLLINPGSAGPAVPGKPITVALMEIHGRGIHVQHVDLAADR